MKSYTSEVRTGLCSGSYDFCEHFLGYLLQIFQLITCYRIIPVEPSNAEEESLTAAVLDHIQMWSKRLPTLRGELVCTGLYIVQWQTLG